MVLGGLCDFRAVFCRKEGDQLMESRQGCLLDSVQNRFL